MWEKEETNKKQNWCGIDKGRACKMNEKGKQDDIWSNHDWESQKKAFTEHSNVPCSMRGEKSLGYSI